MVNVLRRLFGAEPNLARPVSQLCTQSQFAEPVYHRWCDVMREVPRFHRKQWEFCYILSALDHAGMMRPERRGLGFGVGREPIAAVMAASGCEIVATDLAAEEAQVLGWTSTNEHAAALEQVNDRNICSAESFRRLVSFRVADMNHIPSDLTGFDFVWSSCALEHLGSLKHGLDFIRNSLSCLKPGGVAVHTTEYNVSSNADTVLEGGTVLYRRQDIEGFAKEMVRSGHKIELDLRPGDAPLDKHVDMPPYSADNHLKLALDGYVTTSLGLIIRKAA